MSIYVAIYIADIRTPWVKSLKEKRRIVKPVVEKLKVRLPVSVARLDGLNDYTWERVGVSAISADGVWLEGLLERVHSFVCAQGSYEVQVVSSSVEVWDV